MPKSKLSHEDDYRDMSHGRRNFRRSLIDNEKDREYNRWLDSLHANVSVEEIEEEWDEMD